MAKRVYPNDSRTLAIDGGPTYAYVFKAAKPGKPTFLLLHGFPSTSYDWRHQISGLSQAGFGVIAPDLLGYGDTDKPTDVEEYAWLNMSNHVARILQKEGLEKVIGVGHDWGSGLLSRFAIYHGKYLFGSIHMSVAYQRPSHFDLDGLNNLFEQTFGYPCFAYWYFFNEPDAGKVADAHTGKNDPITSLLYAADPEFWKSVLTARGKAKEFVVEGKQSPRPGWISAEEHEIHNEIMKEGGYTGPFNWYKAQIANTDAPNVEKVDPEALKLSFPVLFVAGEKDYVGRPEFMHHAAETGKKEGILQNIEVKVLPTGHWMQLELPDEVLGILVKFAEAL